MTAVAVGSKGPLGGDTYERKDVIGGFGTALIPWQVTSWTRSRRQWLPVMPLTNYLSWVDRPSNTFASRTSDWQ